VASILLVEDHADSARTMSRLLKSLGYDVQIAGSVAEGLACTQRAQYDLLISDIGLPDGTGLELMRQIMQERPIRGIVLSGFGMDDDIRRSLRAGFSEHLTKPVNLNELETAIDRVLRAAQGTV
jgi:CheY-like chemotaxis protein